MKKYTRIMSILFVLLFAMTLFAGCQPQRKPVPPTPGPVVPPDSMPRTEVSPAPDRTPEETNNIAADIANKAGNVSGVKRAYTVVLGNTVLVGVNIDETKQEQGIARVKNRVIQVAEDDPRIVRAYVSTDPDITARIREISDNVRKGRPVTEYLDEIGEIIQRLTPKTS